VSALSHDFRPQAFESTYQKVAPRLKRILLEAAREEVFINIDAEHYH
jgi:RHH-type proline utilization regulon transcriptional repressor/proline dehydrogenase/delta 1-pyrroline-5-carboxylate dehydrogenase